MAISTHTNTPVTISLNVPADTKINLHVNEGNFHDNDINDRCGCGSGNYKPGGSNGKYSDILQDGTIKLQINGGTRGRTEEGISVNDFLSLVLSGKLSPNRPSEYNAAKALNEFMKEHGINSLNRQQLEELASGTLTLPNGQKIDVPEEVEEAAEKMLDNGGAMFNKLKSEVLVCDDGECGDDGGGAGGGGGVSLEDASKSMSNFCDKHDVLLNKDQLARMAMTGEFEKDGKIIELTPQEQASAAKMLEGNNFTAIESALKGETDGLLGAGDHKAAKDKSLLNNDTNGGGGGGGAGGSYDAGSGNGRTITIDINAGGGTDGANGSYGTNGNRSGMPLEDASQSISDFCKTHDVLLSKDQLARMAMTGEFEKDGKIIELTPQQQAACAKMLEGNNFTAIESALKGETDGFLGAGDHAAARNKSLLNNDTNGGSGGGAGGTYDAGNGNGRAINIDIDAGGGTDGANGSYGANGNRGGNGMPLEQASQSISDFCKTHDVLLSKDQLARMAMTGEFEKDGKIIELTPQQQAACAKMLEGNNFAAVESALKGETDGFLGAGDHAAARNKSLLNNDTNGGGGGGAGGANGSYGTNDANGSYGNNGSYGTNGNGNGNGSGISLDKASKSMSDFCDTHDVKLNRDQLSRMAETGEFEKDGKIIELTPEQRASAAKMLEGNNFTAIESAATGEVDGILGKRDHKAAEDKSLLNNDQGQDEGYYSGEE